MTRLKHKTQFVTDRTMSPLETNNPTAVAAEKCNIPEAQEKEFKNNYYEYSQGTIRGY